MAEDSLYTLKRWPGIKTSAADGTQNRGPLVCEVNVITTTLRKVLLWFFGGSQLKVQGTDGQSLDKRDNAGASFILTV